MIFHIFLIVVGLAGLTLGGDLLVKGSSKIASLLKVSPLLIGLTVVSFGTSAPELVVSIKASLQDQASISLANVIGSNLFNTLFILGVCSLAKPLVVMKQVIRFDLPALILLSLIFALFTQDGAIQKWQGGALVLYCFAYLICIFIRSRNNPALAKQLQEEIVADETTISQAPSTRTLAKYALYTLTGFILLVFGARWLITGSVFVARFFNVSDTLIGLTIIATGTSLPELFASLIATIKGEKEIAIGNVVGSNIYNLSIVAGSAAVLSPSLLAVSQSLLSLDILLLVSATTLLLPIVIRKKNFSRLDGIVYSTAFVLYTVYAVTRELNVDAAATLNSLFLLILLPTSLLYVAYVVKGLLKRQTTES